MYEQKYTVLVACLYLYHGDGLQLFRDKNIPDTSMFDTHRIPVVVVFFKTHFPLDMLAQDMDLN